MKKKIFTIILIFTICTKEVLPVPALEITQQARFELEMLLKVHEIKTKWEQTVKEWMTLTEIKDSVQFIKDIQQLKQIMDEWKVDLMDLNIDDPKSQIGALAKVLFDKYTLFDDCQPSYYNDDQKRICKNKMIRSVQEISTFQHYSNQLQSFSNKLKHLSDKLANAADTKESQDITNAINMILAQMEVSKTQVMLMNLKNKSVEKAEARQLEQNRKKYRGVYAF